MTGQGGLLSPINYIIELARDLKLTETKKQELIEGAKGLKPFPVYEERIREKFLVPGKKELAIS